MKIEIPGITKKMMEYTEILFQDCGFSIKQKRDYLQIRYGISYVYQLNFKQGDEVIKDLKSRKEKE